MTTERPLPPVTERSHDLSVGVVGVGQVGSALWHILSKTYHVFPLDPGLGYVGPAHPLDHLHVCIPFSDTFVDDVMVWIAQYEPVLVIIHSTVMPGTTRIIYEAVRSHQLSCQVVVAPTVGEHPHLGEQLLTYLKVLGGMPNGAADMAAVALMSAGFRVAAFETPEEVEWGHLLGLAREGLDVAWTQAVQRLCQRESLNVKHTLYGWTEMENEGRMHLKQFERLHPLALSALEDVRAMEVEQALSLLVQYFDQDTQRAHALEDLRCLVYHGGLAVSAPDPPTEIGNQEFPHV